ncbi:MAG: hypothetical protein H0U59_04715 [Gemmatimonadaceae bacterium]|nr:hypothetical protein [Gemmatimonadaceae bacterium]
MATLEQFRRSVGRKTGMGYDSAGTDRDLLDQWLNEGVREVLLRTHCYTTASTVTTTANEWQYDLSSNIMAIVSIWRDGQDAPMVRMQPEEIQNYRSSSGSGSITRWATSGTNMLLFWPTPTAEYTINLIYVPRPTELSFDTHDPSSATYGGVPVEFHKAIELWALSNASDHEHEQGTQRGVSYLAQFDEYIKRVVKPALARKWGVQPRSRIGRRRYTAWDNDRYPRY